MSNEIKKENKISDKQNNKKQNNKKENNKKQNKLISLHIKINEDEHDKNRDKNKSDFVKTPECLKNKRIVINPQTKDNKSFMDAITLSLFCKSIGKNKVILSGKQVFK